MNPLDERLELEERLDRAYELLQICESSEQAAEFYEQVSRIEDELADWWDTYGDEYE